MIVFDELIGGLLPTYDTEGGRITISMSPYGGADEAAAEVKAKASVLPDGHILIVPWRMAGGLMMGCRSVRGWAGDVIRYPPWWPSEIAVSPK